MIKFFTEIHLWGIVVRDPVTAFTNLLMSMAGLICYLKVSKLRMIKDGAKEWSYFFLFFSIATGTGIIVHGFSYYTPEKIHFWIWITMGWLQMIGILFAQIATIKLYWEEKITMIRIIGSLQLVSCAILMVVIKKFGAVNIDTALGLLPIMILTFIQHSNHKVNSPMLGVGIAFAIIPAIVVALKWSIGIWFNFTDLAHVLLTISVVLMGIGVVRNLRSTF